MKEKAISIFTEAVKGVEPGRVTADALEGLLGEIDPSMKLSVIGMGKAAFPMAKAVEECLRDRITTGAIITKYGHGGSLNKIDVFEAGHPIPDEEGIRGAIRILEIAKSAGEGDLVIVLISGGGSALLTAPAGRPESGISLSDLKVVNELLISRGLDIHDINTIRKHISLVKGGRLALAAWPARVISLILSDVVGDDISTIASGPTAPDPTTFKDALGIIEKYALEDEMPSKAMSFLRAGFAGDVPETPDGDDPVFNSVKNIVVGNSALALTSAEKKAKELGFRTLILSSSFTGDTRELSLFHAGVAREILTNERPIPSPACIISGGESTVVVEGKGKGGRNSEFALNFATQIMGLKGVYGLFVGSDGTDGPTDAAGAFARWDSVEKAHKMGLDAMEYLKNNDSYSFFEALDDLIITGPTRTNVMDIRLVFVLDDESG